MVTTNSPLTLVVLAAGMGSRYGGLKQLDPVGPHDEVILDYSVYDALQAGVDKVVFVIRRDFEDAFRKSLGNRFENRLTVDYVFQDIDALPDGCVKPAGRTKPWGTGHAVLAARHAVDTPFIVINADDFYGRQSYAALADYLRRAASMPSKLESISMVGFPLRNTLSEHGTVARGLCRCSAAMDLESVTEITSIRKTASGAAYDGPDGETINLTGDELVSMNMWGFLPSFFPLLEERFRGFMHEHGKSETAEFYIPFAVDALIRRGLCQRAGSPRHQPVVRRHVSGRQTGGGECPGETHEERRLSGAFVALMEKLILVCTYVIIVLSISACKRIPAYDFSELLVIEEGAKGAAVASYFKVLNYRLFIEPLDRGNLSLRDLVGPKEFEIVLVTLDQGTPKRITIKYDDLEIASWSVKGNLKSSDNSLVLKQGLDGNQFLDEVAKGTPIAVVRVAGMRGAWVLGLLQSGYY